MKDEEIDKMADDFVNAQDFTKVYGFARKAECGAFWKYGFLAGLKAGRPQWHNLEKDPNDLPKGQINRYLFGYVKNYRGKKPMLISYNGEWFYDANTYNTEVKVIAWCEIPTFDKE